MTSASQTLEDNEAQEAWCTAAHGAAQSDRLRSRTATTDSPICPSDIIANTHPPIIQSFKPLT